MAEKLVDKFGKPFGVDENPFSVAPSSTAAPMPVSDATIAGGQSPTELLLRLVVAAEKQNKLLGMICGLLTPAGEIPIESDEL